MTQIILIRHGQSANNAQPDHLRVPDPGLTALGIRQAEATARWCENLPISRLYCSPFLRALETTRPIAKSTNLCVEIRADIFEVGGCYSGHEAIGKSGAAGLGCSHLKSQYVNWNIDPAIREEGWWGRDFESEDAAQARAASVAEWMERELAPQGGIHVLVIHADFKRLLIAALLKSAGPGLIETLGTLHNVGVTRFVWQRDRFIATSINATNHLPHDWVTD